MRIIETRHEGEVVNTSLAGWGAVGLMAKDPSGEWRDLTVDNGKHGPYLTAVRIYAGVWLSPERPLGLPFLAPSEYRVDVVFGIKGHKEVGHNLGMSRSMFSDPENAAILNDYPRPADPSVLPPEYHDALDDEFFSSPPPADYTTVQEILASPDAVRAQAVRRAALGQPPIVVASPEGTRANARFLWLIGTGIAATVLAILLVRWQIRAGRRLQGRCGYSLAGIEVTSCPECGRQGPSA